MVSHLGSVIVVSYSPVLVTRSVDLLSVVQDGRDPIIVNREGFITPSDLSLQSRECFFLTFPISSTEKESYVSVVTFLYS